MNHSTNNRIERDVFHSHSHSGDGGNHDVLLAGSRLQPCRCAFLGLGFRDVSISDGCQRLAHTLTLSLSLALSASLSLSLYACLPVCVSPCQPASQPACLPPNCLEALSVSHTHPHSPPCRRSHVCRAISFLRPGTASKAPQLQAEHGRDRSTGMQMFQIECSGLMRSSLCSPYALTFRVRKARSPSGSELWA